MSDLLSIGASGVSVYQRALATVSNNIANLGTDGYSRQTTEIGQSSPIQAGKGFIGTGAYFDRVARQYDSFLESALQGATSDLESQQAVAEYSSRLVDLLGGEDTGLVSPLNQFFTSAKNLSTDPASSAFRASFLRTADELATRINSLDEQLIELKSQALSAMEADIQSINGLATQLAEINGQLLKKPVEEKQPPALLDQRDSTLRKISEYAGIKTEIDKQGLVSVSLTDSMLKGLLVNEIEGLQLRVEEAGNRSTDLAFSLKGGEGSAPISNVRSGSIGGFSDFIETTIVQVRSQLDDLTSVLVDEVNRIQTEGLDLNGEQGEQLFVIESSVALDQSTSRGVFEVSFEASTARELREFDAELTWDAAQQVWNTNDANGMVDILSTDPRSPVINGLQLRINGEPKDGDVFTISVERQASAGIRLALSSGEQIAAASIFRATPGETNQGGGDVVVSFSGQDAISGNPNIVSSRQASPSTLQPLGIITAGKTQSTISLAPALSSDASIQIFTKDGTHLIGGPVSGIDYQDLIDQNEIFEAGSTYNNDYLSFNTAINGAYKDWSLEFGALADRNVETQLTPLSNFSLNVSDTATFEDGFLEFTTLATDENTTLGFVSSASASSTLGLVSVVGSEVFVGDGSTAQKIGDVSYPSSPSVPSFDSLTVQFVSAPAMQIGQSELQQLAAKLTYSNGKDLTSTPLDLRTTLSIKAAEATGGDQWQFEQPVVGSELLAAGSVNTSDLAYRGVIRSKSIPLATGAGDIIEAGAVSLNGVALSNLIKSPGADALSVEDVKRWIDAVGDSSIEVQTANRVFVDAADIALNGSGIAINGTIVASVATGSNLLFDDLNDLTASINSVSGVTGVVARTDPDGGVVLLNANGNGDNIRIDSALSGVTENTLGISNGVYRGSFSIVQESSTPGTLSLTLNEGYGPQELAAIGLTTSARISGDIDEELAVFLVGGDGDISVDSVEAETDFVSALRKRQFEFLINDDDTLSIVDLTTDSVVATRAYAGEQVIHYQGITLSLEFPGEAGDRFVVDGNNAGPNQTFDAHGNNQNILRLARLQSDPVISGGNTLSQAYLQLVGDAGNKATQAEISAQATDVLKQQATEARDRVSGVSLDQEAADLIRFQQAYQASAQVMQVASTIFDAILQVR